MCRPGSLTLSEVTRLIDVVHLKPAMPWKLNVKGQTSQPAPAYRLEYYFFIMVHFYAIAWCQHNNQRSPFGDTRQL